MQIRQNIDFKQIAAETGVRKGKIAYSETFKSWVVIGHTEIDMICIKPPKQKGEKIDGRTIEAVKIENNQWLFICL